MFGPDDPGYSAATLRSFHEHPAQWHAERNHARQLVGCAAGHVVCGTAADLRQAQRAINQAIRLFMTTGLSRGQAVDQVVSFAEMLGSLE
jgi:uncharacterized protein YoaH (UPF0181 family)